jgi:diguanylate cyclase (GGDEF)-like protein
MYKKIKSYTSIVDVDAQKNIDEDIVDKHRYLKSIIDNVPESVMVIKEDYSIEFMNAQAKRKIFSTSVSNLDSPKCYELLQQRSSPCAIENRRCPLREVCRSKEPTTIIHEKKDKLGNINFIEVAATPLTDENLECIGIIRSERNINSQVKLVDELKKKSQYFEYKANHDALTSLPNRFLFNDRLEREIVASKRDRTKLALLFIDLDYFKEINDKLGHLVGDEVLKEVANKIKLIIREKDTLSRLGGDEFTIIMEGVKSLEDTSVLAKKIIKIFEDSFIILEYEVKLSCSIGISIYPNDDDSAQNLLMYADKAMYKAKNSGKNTFKYYG